MSRLFHLVAAGVSLLLEAPQASLPRVLYWGADLGVDLDLSDGLALACVPGIVPADLDAPVVPEILPQHATGWMGIPGLQAHRDGQDWSPCFATTTVDVTDDGDGRGGRVEIGAADAHARLALRITVELTPDGLLRTRADLLNDHPDGALTLDGLVLALPVPLRATEVLDLTGRWTRERSPQRHDITVGAHARDVRRGRTGHDSPTLLCLGEPAFGFRSGEVWAVHVSWSGNQRTYAERLPNATTLLGGGELLLPGEVRLEPGERYATPWLVGSYGRGLDEVSARIHRWQRARGHHPHSPRPVVLNTWEAVYFGHDLDTLTRLADTAAQVGVERFVLDDGWFAGRRDDTAGLGDWTVDTDVWPRGLHPLAEHVTSLGMEFGLWVEPEMVNVDSDLARAHPEWLMATGWRLPIEGRHQQVLDLGHSGAFEYVLTHLDALLAEYPIAYLKWDHNRQLVDAGHSPSGRPGVHAQTLALYRLMDELRSRHPGLEIESCSSGGGRIDLEILQRTDRVWTSDCNDALERQRIQRWTSLLVPLEMLGAHIGPPVSHTTGRRHGVAFRAATALFGHLGIEWDIASASPDDLDELAAWIALYRRLRPLLHSGDLVRGDHPDTAWLVQGVVSPSADHAVFSLAAMDSSVGSPPGQVLLPGLADDRVYEVSLPAPGGNPPGVAYPPWVTDVPLSLPGSVLSRVGLQLPALWPEHALLVEVTAP
jgi:alpha-galactosidase